MSDWNADVENITSDVNQLLRLKRMGETLQDVMVFSQVLDIKIAVSKEDYEYAKQLFDEFTHEEQQAINIAPSKGGIFTTFERKVIKFGRAEI